MCGIVGGTRPTWSYEAAVERLRHRGPDSQRTLKLEKLNLGFTRLAVIDPRDVADQPMASEDGRVQLLFNGEIYGYRGLRRELEGAGRAFRTLSDTEVLLQAYLEWGDGFVDRLDGMFAVAIYDARRDHLLKLYRDRPGIKPLYYYRDGRDFAFASELKAIEALVGVEALRRDPTAVYDFLTYRYVPDPKTLYRDVHKLPPASRLVFDLGRGELTALERYWELPVAVDRRIDLDDACLAVREAMEVSVTEQMVADVPVGFFLSGGMDSSVVVAAATRSDNELRTFSIGFDVAEHTETRYAKQVAEHFRTSHREEVLGRDATEDLFGCLKSWYDEPFADTSAIPTFLVSRCAREEVTVALSGDGGDELFGGYRWYPRYRRLRRSGCGWTGDRSVVVEAARALSSWRLWQRALNLATLAGSDELSLYVQLMGGMTRGEKRPYAELLGIEPDYDDCWFFRRHWRPDLPLLTRLQVLDFHTFLPGDILTKVDRASMACSLEVRVPFLSRRTIELAFSLPQSVRYHQGELKGLLKLAYRGILPQAVLERGKKGFSLPPQYRPAGGRRRFQERVLDELFDVRP